MKQMENNLDFGHVETDKLLETTEREIGQIYLTANTEIKDKIKNYLSRFEKKDKIKREQLEKGIISFEEYRKWRIAQFLAGRRWVELRNVIANDYHNINVIARTVIDNAIPDIYVLNVNYETFRIESSVGIDTGFTLYNREAVVRILRDNPSMLPAPGKALAKRIEAGKDILWNKQQLQSVMMQGIIQGESIPSIATRLENVTEKNRNNAIRNARTMATTAENAGRMDAMKRAQSKGLRIQKTWVATLDFRTRHTHRVLDGQTRPIDEPFLYDGIKIMQPGDLTAPPAMIYNCRCSVIEQINGFERDLSNLSLRKSDKLEGMSYEDWKESKRMESNKITKPDEVADIMKRKYIADYRRRK